MPQHEWLEVGLKAMWLAFVFAWGACLGSLINVLVYRLPLGMDVVSTPSRCPACETKLTWRENVPVLGWLSLGGKCRFCRSRISAEYPLVELLVGLLWVGLFVLWYIIPPEARWLGIDIGRIRPDWALSDAWDAWPRTTWPLFLGLAMLVAGLVAMTLTDLKTFTIPLILPWVVTGVGLATHVLGGLINAEGLKRVSPGWAWAIPTPGGANPATPDAWWWIGLALGASVGLVVANLLLHFKLIRRSFDDYAEWENANYPAPPQPEQPAQRPGEYLVGEHAGSGVQTILTFTLVWLGCIVVGGLLGALIAPRLGVAPWWGVLLGTIAGPFIAAVVCREPPVVDTPPDASGPTAAPEMWIAYPHARREMFKEIVFLTPPIALGMLGGWITQQIVAEPAPTPPLWLLALAGSLLGYLIGGGVVWGVRILGSLGFGKEAMGLGDVHLMAAVGAVAGWIAASIAVPIAAVVGLYWFVISALMRRPAGRAMPFGPYLAIASLLVIVGRPALEQGLNWLMATGIDSPQITLP
jgi:leader peptidase (prepilin peptidase)/N-methyltransferase